MKFLYIHFILRLFGNLIFFFIAFILLIFEEWGVAEVEYNFLLANMQTLFCSSEYIRDKN